MKSKHPEPATFTPRSPSEFIGPARDLAAVLSAKARALHDRREGNLKYVITGQPGIGKTTLAEYLAAHATRMSIEKRIRQIAAKKVRVVR